MTNPFSDRQCQLNASSNPELKPCHVAAAWRGHHLLEGSLRSSCTLLAGIRARLHLLDLSRGALELPTHQHTRARLLQAFELGDSPLLELRPSGQQYAVDIRVFVGDNHSPGENRPQQAAHVPGILQSYPVPLLFEERSACRHSGTWQVNLCIRAVFNDVPVFPPI